MSSLSPLRLIVSMAAIFLLFAALPQGLGYAVNRLFSRWKIASRMLGAILPVVAITIILGWVSDREAAAIEAGGHGVAFLPLVLVPMHVAIALMLQSQLTYGSKSRPN